ncbi:MAG: lipid-A-disaccharide synthase [Bacteroidaceae bacterium]|nr:lipid-A-disaccharide synthase [Bacteroidaceae bacterium]
MKYYIVAGEASGDLHASNLMESIRKRDPEASFRCFGGDMMKAAGGTLVKHYRELAYMGVWPVLTHLGTILRGARLCFRDLSSWNPDAVILVDYPGFNLSIARKVHSKLHIPVWYYISPKIWAWKSYRIRNIRRDVDELFSILPFETGYYGRLGYPVRYVGNPTVDEVSAYLDSHSEPSLFMGEERKIVALLAGSRRQEISRNLPVMLKAVEGLENIRVVLACAPSIPAGFYEDIIRGHDVECVYGNTYGVLQSAYAALVTSGTATLETALFGVPQVVCYGMPVKRIAGLIRRLFLKTDHVSLVNLISGCEVVPELVADSFSLKNVKDNLYPLLSDTPERRAQIEGYARMKGILGPAGAPEHAAAQMAGLLESVHSDREPDHSGGNGEERAVETVQHTSVSGQDPA